MKEISVIIPVYNSERYIKACIDSLLSQTVRECMEVIFINDQRVSYKAQRGFSCKKYGH